MSTEKVWRWFGPNDPITLEDIRQTGATGIVTALHEIPNGEIWPVEQIKERQKFIEWNYAVNPPVPSGLKWSVVESVPVHEDIKTGSNNASYYIENYKQTLKNLGLCGINVVCYNFMPVLDWTRTDLNYKVDDGSEALSFDADAFAAFDLYILKRPGSDKDHTEEEKDRAYKKYESMNYEQIEQLSNNILKGLPGSEEGYTLKEFQKVLDKYQNINDQQLKANLIHFLKEVAPVAEESGVKLAIHPDDPPRKLLGLPRVVSKEKDLQDLLAAYDSPYNGFTMCTGSYGVRPDNDLPGMINRYGSKLNFIHLRSVQRGTGNTQNFYEANHLEGSLDMFAIFKAIIEEQEKRKKQQTGWESIPMRPDHGHKMLDDKNKNTNPGYSAIGRLKGLSELKGLEMGIEKMLKKDK